MWALLISLTHTGIASWPTTDGARHSLSDPGPALLPAPMLSPIQPDRCPRCHWAVTSQMMTRSHQSSSDSVRLTNYSGARIMDGEAVMDAVVEAPPSEDIAEPTDTMEPPTVEPTSVLSHSLPPTRRCVQGYVCVLSRCLQKSARACVCVGVLVVACSPKLRCAWPPTQRGAACRRRSSGGSHGSCRSRRACGFHGSDQESKGGAVPTLSNSPTPSLSFARRHSERRRQLCSTLRPHPKPWSE